MSPVFDVAKRLRIFEVEEGTITGQSNHSLEDDSRALRLLGLGVDVLICAAITWSLETSLWAAGVEVIPEVCGPVDEVIEAFLRGAATLKPYLAPGHADQDAGHFLSYLSGKRQSDSPRPTSDRGLRETTECKVT